MKSSDLLELSRELTRQNQPHAWITVISVTSPSSSYVGAQAIVRSDGELSGWIGGGCVQSAARAAALRSIASAIPQRLRLSNTKDPSEAIDVRPMACASNGEVELFIQPAAVAPRLRIYGNTPIVRIAAWLAREADFDPLTDQEAADVEALANSGKPAPAPANVPSPLHEPTPATTVERETYALIATQGDGDEAALEAALRSCARAVLVIASKRKAERLRTAMKLRGISPDRIDAMHAPAGPDIGAVTPNEIALAAVAGLVALRRGHAPSSTQQARLAHTKHTRPAQASVETQPVTGYVNPVCGAVVDPARALSSLTMSGQTHYFCCQGCRTEFERDPEKYLEIGSHMREPARTTYE
jgi:xanthine dehydrogenase accessory factor